MKLNIKENKTLEQKYKELQKENGIMGCDFYDFKEYITKYIIENGKEKEFLAYIKSSFENDEVHAEDITHYTDIIGWLEDELKVKEPKNRGFITRLKEHIKEENFTDIVVEPTTDALGREFIQVRLVDDEAPSEYPTIIAMFINEGEAFNYALELFRSAKIDKLAYCPMDEKDGEYEVYTQKDNAELRALKVSLNQ
ncbi:hypothetical protein [Bacillus atrophaeus]|uniref:hypothetical protein n=1 Tax=Bacillus atrophaeus TaxID=1452 RepID=UPI0038731270